MKKMKNKGLIILVILISLTLITNRQTLGNEMLDGESVGLINYLPLLVKTSPRQASIFGTQVTPHKVNSVVDLMAQADLAWLRINAFNWDDIEPVRTEPPTYVWNDTIDFHLQKATENGLNIIATIRFAPSWAQRNPPAACGQIREDSFDEYAQFLQALVNRYSKPPYNIKYWELGNEPDVAPNLVEDDSPYGCWGDESDQYYGGGYYADMLKVAYPAIKSADPTAQVLIGGLLLVCDPTDPPDGKTCHAAKFFEGILKNGGGNYFDIVSFHGYPPYSGAQGGGLYYDEHYLGWESRGGIVLGKINFLREVMTNYSLNKPIMHTEGSLICTSCETPGTDFLESQADYVIWLYVRNIAEGIKSTIWYQFDGPGWRFGGMLDENQDPKPAYRALDFLTEELAGAGYKSPVTQYASLRGFEFRNSQNRIWVLWSPDGGSHTINLPAGFQRVLDKYGVDITPSTSSISVKSPIYVELAP
jgi:hypothetical protein